MLSYSYEYVLLVLIFDAVFSHLSLTNDCTVKKLMMFYTDLPCLFLEMLVETNQWKQTWKLLYYTISTIKIVHWPPSRQVAISYAYIQVFLYVNRMYKLLTIINYKLTLNVNLCFYIANAWKAA